MHQFCEKESARTAKMALEKPDFNTQSKQQKENCVR
jgi:hypothetical protein